MVGADLRSIIGAFFKLASLAGTALYAGLVLVNYRTEGSHLRPRVDWRDPAHSAKRWAVWLGVMAFAVVAHVASRIFTMLSEASADVGEWFLSHRHHETH